MTNEERQEKEEDKDPIPRVPDLDKEIAELQAKNKTLEEQQKNLLQTIQTLYSCHQNLIAAIEAKVETDMITDGRLATVKAQNRFEFPMSKE
jgi:cell division protein FtsB